LKWYVEDPLRWIVGLRVPPDARRRAERLNVPVSIDTATGEGTIGALWRLACLAARDDPAFLCQQDGGWAPVGWREASDRVNQLGAGFIASGVAKGDRVALLARTRFEWTLCDFALASIGAVLVPIYPNASPAEVEFILGDCGVTLTVVETPRQLRRLHKLALVEAVVMEGESDRPSLDVVAERGRAALAGDPSCLDRRRAQVCAGDVLTYLYTSGTTGRPKACVLTHRNFTAMTEAVTAMHVVTSDDSLLLFLPLAHNFARLMQYTAVREGVTLAYCRDFIGVPKALDALRPTVLPGVPRFYERVASQVRGEIDAAGGVRGAAARWSLAVGRRAAAQRDRGSQPGPLLRAKLAAADRLVFKRARSRLGGELRLGVSGGAALPQHVAELFDAIGIVLLEGYGLSEATCASHFNRPNRRRVGTVGLPLPGIGARLDVDGEILISGDTVFAGYLGDAAATASVMTGDGWLRTGDVGELDDDGFLRIIDRKKDLIVTSGGKNVAPQKLENALSAEPLVSQALVIGDGRPYLVALIAPDLAEVRRLGATRDQVEQRIDTAVKRLNREVGKAERIARHMVLDREFSQEDGEVTATLKLRRRTCAGRFAAEIDQLYKDRLSSA